MEVSDARGKNIMKGSHVRYTGTGSAGEVLDVKSNGEGSWARIDTTDLWYNSQYLEVIEKQQFEKIKLKKTQETTESSADEKERAKKVSLQKKIGEGVDMSSELCDGGG
jgi:hypothetical protein